MTAPSTADSVLGDMLRPLQPGQYVRAPHRRLATASAAAAATTASGPLRHRSRSPPTTLPFPSNGGDEQRRAGAEGRFFHDFGMHSLSADGDADEESGADTGHPLPPSWDLRAALAVPRAPATPRSLPPPAPGPVPASCDPVTGLPLPDACAAEAVEYVTLEEVSDTMRDKWRTILNQRLAPGAGPPDGQEGWRARYNQCVLCAYGNRAIDGSSLGSHLFNEMARIVELYFLTTEPIALVGMLHRFYEDCVRPAFATANHLERLPPFNPSNVLEHLTTAVHTQNPRLLIANKIRDLDRIDTMLKQHMVTTTGLVDLKVVSAQTRLSETILKWATTSPAKFAFGGGSASGDINPDLLAHLTRQQAQEEAAKTLTPSTLSWLHTLGVPSPTAPVAPDPAEPAD